MLKYLEKLGNTQKEIVQNLVNENCKGILEEGM